MKYFYSYYPLRGIKSEEVFFDLICIKLSSTILKKEGKYVGIYSTKSFIDLLKKYKVDLDFYEDIENEIKNIVSDKMFAISKVYSNMIQKEPFIQLDCDTILFDNFNFDKFENTKVLFHMPEGIDYNSPYQIYMWWRELYMDFYYDINKRFPYITNEKYMTPLIAYNCAIVGGTDWKVISDAYLTIFDFIKNNVEYLEAANYYPMPELEQQLVVGLLSKAGYNTHIEDGDSSRITFISDKQDVVLVNDAGNMTLKYNNKSLSMKWDGKFEDFKHKELLSLVYEQFNGFIHLTAAKNVLGIKNLIYEMLRLKDSVYVNWIEGEFGIQFEFQKKLYTTII